MRQRVSQLEALLAQRGHKKRRHDFRSDDESGDDDDSSVLANELRPKRDPFAELKASFSLLFAHIIVDNHGIAAVIPATLNRDFLGVLDTRPKSADLFRAWDRLFAGTRSRLIQLPHFLAKKLSSTFVPTSPLFHLTSKGELVSKSLYLYSKDELQSVVSMISFALPNLRDPEYLAFQAQVRLERCDSAADQLKQHRVKKETKLFCKTMFDTDLDSIFSMVANFLAFASSVVEVPTWSYNSGNPTIVNFFHQLCDELSKADAEILISNVSKVAPYIFHSIFEIFNDLLSSFGRILKETPVIYDHMAKRPVDSTHFVGPVAVFQDSLEALKRFIVSHSMAGRLATEPITYRIFHPLPRAPAQDGDSIKSPKDDSKTPRDDSRSAKRAPGWLAMVNANDPDSWKKFARPAGVQVFCLKFAFQGITCVNAKCKFNHRIFPKDFSEAEIALLNTYVTSNADKYKFVVKEVSRN